MKKNNPVQRWLLVDPVALAVACIISLLFANGTQQYLHTAKRNVKNPGSQTVVCFQLSADSSPEDRPDAWGINKENTFKALKKNSSQLPVTFGIREDYGTRLSGCFYGLPQPFAWLPSIPIAHRKLII